MKASSVNLSNEFEWLLHFLWHRKEGVTPVRYNFCIPDTLVYKAGKASIWYFTSKKDGSILKKHKRKLNNKVINEKFLVNKQSDPAIATTYSYTITKYSHKCQVEHVHVGDFRPFLFFDDKMSIHIIQKFI